MGIFKYISIDRSPSRSLEGWLPITWLSISIFESSTSKKDTYLQKWLESQKYRLSIISPAWKWSGDMIAGFHIKGRLIPGMKIEVVTYFSTCAFQVLDSFILEHLLTKSLHLARNVSNLQDLCSCSNGSNRSICCWGTRKLYFMSRNLLRRFIFSSEESYHILEVSYVLKTTNSWSYLFYLMVNCTTLRKWFNQTILHVESSYYVTHQSLPFTYSILRRN